MAATHTSVLISFPIAFLHNGTKLSKTTSFHSSSLSAHSYALFIELPPHRFTYSPQLLPVVFLMNFLCTFYVTIFHPHIPEALLPYLSSSLPVTSSLSFSHGFFLFFLYAFFLSFPPPLFALVRHRPNYLVNGK